MKRFIVGFALAGIAAAWIGERIKTAHLQVQVDALNDVPSELADARAEHTRLNALQVSPDAWQELRRAGTERDRLRREIAERREAQPQNESFASGDMQPANAWKKRGQQSPSDAIETTLWAAAGGDLVALKDLIWIDDSVRVQAEQLHRRLPSSARAVYSDPADMIVAMTAKAIPLGDAQLVWQQPNGPEEAMACVVLSESGPDTVPLASTPGSNEPPVLASKFKIRTAFFALRRNSNGWKLVLPPQAITQMARDLGTAGKD